MDEKWSKWRNKVYSKLILVILLFSSFTLNSAQTNQDVIAETEVDNELKNYVNRVFSTDNVEIVPGIKITKIDNATKNVEDCDHNNTESVEEYVRDKLDGFARTHSVSIDMKETARFLYPSGDKTTTDAGKSSFLAGFGMGFLAFALKKLLLPVFIGAQLLKSVMLAMFLPSILGGLGKIVGKGLSTFSGVSGASTGINNNHQQQLEEFEFKDTDPYNNESGLGDNLDAAADDSSSLANVDLSNNDTPTNSRLGIGTRRKSYFQPHSTHNSYMPKNKKTDYKVFHKIPSSSVILAKFDPFYSPLLSRLDAIFQQLGLGNDKSQESERCKERLVCMMYANPAKYAPYSNLVSALLSKELSELRKPSLADPEILRFFRYMKAAKDGQDGQQCQAYGGCLSLTAHEPSPAMLTTFNDINKLVLARNLK